MDLSQPAGMWAILAGASLVVKGIMLLLVAMSLTSWSIIFYKIIALNRARVKAASDFESFQTAEDLSMAFQQLGRNPASPVYAVGYQAVNELKKLEKSKLVGKDLGATVLENLDRTLRLACKTKIRELGSSLPFLATCANAAPFIGLFGTVWGIMDSFHAIGQMKTASLATVAPGISEALIATAIGLAVAIPATMAYNMFLGMLTNIEIELANFSDVFLNRVRREASWERTEAPAQPSRTGF